MATINTRLQFQNLATNGSIGHAITLYALMRRRKKFILDETKLLPLYHGLVDNNTSYVVTPGSQITLRDLSSPRSTIDANISVSSSCCCSIYFHRLHHVPILTSQVEANKPRVVGSHSTVSMVGCSVDEADISLAGRLASLHYIFGGKRVLKWTPLTEMAKKTLTLFKNNNALEVGACLHDPYNQNHRDYKYVKNNNPLLWIVYRQLYASMKGCESAASENLTILLAENPQTNHEGYTKLHEAWMSSTGQGTVTKSSSKKQPNRAHSKE
jgi:hypothetical protein